MIIANRNAYFPSSGAASSSPAYDSYWTDTSHAQRLGGVYDAPSGSADSQVQLTGTSPGAGNVRKSLLAQYVFPAFGSAMVWLGETGTGWLIAADQPTCLMQYMGPDHAVGAIYIAKIFQGSGTLRGYMSGPPFGAGGMPPNGPMVGYYFSLGSNSVPSQPQSTDYLVVELGISVVNFSTLPSYTVTFQFGDGHSSWDRLYLPAAGNSGFILAWNGTFGSPPSSSPNRFRRPLVPVCYPLQQIPFGQAPGAGLNQAPLNTLPANN